MDDKPVRQGIPMREVKAKKEFSTLTGHYMMLGSLVLMYLAYVLWLAMGDNLLPGDVNGIATLYNIQAAFCNKHMVAPPVEKHIHDVRHTKPGGRMKVNRDEVKAAEIVRDLPDYIRVDLAEGLMDEATDTPIVFPKDKGFRFPFSRKAGECFLQHVHVTGDERWKKRRRKRAGRMET